jgi:hypothetical protein
MIDIPIIINYYVTVLVLLFSFSSFKLYKIKSIFYSFLQQWKLFQYFNLMNIKT